MQYERKYANYTLLMCICFLLPLYQHLATAMATKKANTESHKLLVHLHTHLPATGAMPLPHFFRLCVSLAAYLVQCIEASCHGNNEWIDTPPNEGDFWPYGS